MLDEIYKRSSSGNVEKIKAIYFGFSRLERRNLCIYTKFTLNNSTRQSDVFSAVRLVALPGFAGKIIFQSQHLITLRVLH